MDAHKRFMEHRTTEVQLLLDLIPRNGTADLFNSLINGFNRDVEKINQLIHPLSYLETVRTILCSLYKGKEKLKTYTLNCYAFRNISVERLQVVLCDRKLDAETLSLVLDILVLQMVLCSHVSSIVSHINNLPNLRLEHLSDGEERNTLDVKLLNCYMDSLLLHKRFVSYIERSYLEAIGTSFRLIVGTWLESMDYKKCQSLTLLLPKLIEVSHDYRNFTLIWDMIFTIVGDPGSILTILCLTADLWFPIESELDPLKLINNAMEERFWRVLLKGLSSSVSEQRKQALYLVKRVVDFTDEHKVEGKELGDYQEIKPLICTGNYSQQKAFKKNFFLILETLEEKEEHLIQPVFTLLKNLIKNTRKEENCETGFHIAWIRCALSRILQHYNIPIVKYGLLYILTLDLELYNDEFLSILLDALNNPSLYEKDTDEGEPTVVDGLMTFLNNAETRNHHLVTRFMVKASKMNWAPLALYHVIHALSLVKRVGSVWKNVELEAVKSLAGINLNMHCPILRIGSQIELLEVMTHFATESLDVAVVANVLSMFPPSEALIRGQLAWERTSAWLSKIVGKDKALKYVEKVCGSMMNGNSHSDRSIESFSLIIMLFYDGNLVLNSKSCPGFTSLGNLLNCLVGAENRLNADTESRNTSMRLIYHLLKFTSSNDRILRELISDYADASLRFTFKNLRKVTDETLVDDISTQVLVTQQLFTAESSIISKREVLKHIDRFETESWNIIEDGEDSNNIQRLFGIKILHACLKAMSTKQRNYDFIDTLYQTYRKPMIQSSRDFKKANKRYNERRNSRDNIAAEYYKVVAELLHEYVKDESVDQWIPDIDWIEQVTYLIQVGSGEIFVPLVGILSQIFYKEAVKAAEMDNFKSAVKLCWNSTLESNECRLATEEMIDLIFSSPFLESEEMRELTIEFTGHMIERGDKIPELSIILVRGLKQAKGEYLPYFYEAILACLLHGAAPSGYGKIELQARSSVLNSYQEIYPNYLSDMNVNTSVATRAHAVTLLHKMITDNPSYAAALLPLITEKLNENHKKLCSEDLQNHRLEYRIMQVLFILQPMLENGDIESLHTSICNTMLSECIQPCLRILLEWLLARLYLDSESLRAKIWNLLDQGKAQSPSNFSSIVGIVYRVAQLLSSELQLNFINLALQYIMPYCMAPQVDVRLYAQVTVSKLYDLATELCYSTITEKYKDLNIVTSRSLSYGNLMKNSIEPLDEIYSKIFDPIEDYSLQTVFYELPRLSNISSDEYIPPQLFEKFGFKESNSHPLKLLNLRSDVSEAQVSAHMLKTSRSKEPSADDFHSSANCSGNIREKCIPWNLMTLNKGEVSEISKILSPRRKSPTVGDKIIIVASLIDKLPDVGALSKTCEILGVEEFVVASISHMEDTGFQSLSGSPQKLIPLVEVKPQQLQQYLVEKRDMGYELVGAEQTGNSTNLMDMKFEKKTVLLLGNENAGIPCNLLPLLDQSVEIPQIGLFKSLDVHVTGTICLWEYFKQHRRSP